LKTPVINRLRSVTKPVDVAVVVVVVVFVTVVVVSRFYDETVECCVEVVSVVASDVATKLVAGYKLKNGGDECDH